MKRNSFYMIIEDVIYLRNRGLIATGKVEGGEVSIGETVRLETPEGELKKENIKLDGIEIFGHISTASEGMNVGLFFKLPYVQSLSDALEVLPVHKGDIIKK